MVLQGDIGFSSTWNDVPTWILQNGEYEVESLPLLGLWDHEGRRISRCVIFSPHRTDGPHERGGFVCDLQRGELLPVHSG